jgi:hypothetical protein
MFDELFLQSDEETSRHGATVPGLRKGSCGTRGARWA